MLDEGLGTLVLSRASSQRQLLLFTGPGLGTSLGSPHGTRCGQRASPRAPVTCFPQCCAPHSTGVKEGPQRRLLTAPLLSLAGPLCASWVQGGAGAPWPAIFPEQGSSQGSTFPALASATNQRHTSPPPQVTPRPPGMTGASGAGGTHQPSPQASPERTGPTHDFHPKGSRRLSCSTSRNQSPL